MLKLPNLSMIFLDRRAVQRRALRHARRGHRLVRFVRRLQFLLHRAGLHFHRRAAAGTVRAADFPRRRGADRLADRARARPARRRDQERRDHAVRSTIIRASFPAPRAPTTSCGRPRRICMRRSAAASCFWSPRATSLQIRAAWPPDAQLDTDRHDGRRAGRSRRTSPRAGEPAPCRTSTISSGRWSPRAGRSRSAASSRIRRNEPITARTSAR